MPPLPEPHVIAKAIAGDRAAFNIVVETCQPFVLAVSYRFLRNTEDARDATQETFIRLWKNMARYNTEVKLTTWLYKICTNLCLDVLKNRSRRSTNIVETDSAHHVHAPTHTDDPILQEEFKTMIATLTDSLTPRQQAVFILRDVEDLPVDEVCEILDLSAANVKSNLYYARQTMARLIEQYHRKRKSPSL